MTDYPKSDELGIIRHDPDGPECGPILLIHRGKDSFLTFHRKRDIQRSPDDKGEFENLCSIKVGELENIFPYFRYELERDSYVSINSYYRAGRFRSRAIPAFAAAYRKSEGVRYLNACFADLDCYKLDITVGQAIGRVIELQDAGRIPPASIIVRSGRGVWLFWLLHDPDDPQLPPWAWPEKQFLWMRIQREIGHRLALLGSDAAAKDLARLTRVPGSVHGVTGYRVEYWIQKRSDGRGFSYTLPELKRFFGLQLAEAADATKAAFKDRRNTHGGFKRVWESQLRQFEWLRHKRGGFTAGTRNNAAYVYAYLMIKSGASRQVVVNEVTKLGYHDCDPKLTISEIKGAVDSGYKVKPKKMGAVIRGGLISNQTIADLLQITPEESAQLEKFPSASCFGPAPKALAPAPEIWHAELDKILESIRASKRAMPPLRELSAMLEKKSGLKVSHVQVSKYLNKSGNLSPRSRKAREKARAEKKNRQKSLFAVSPQA